MTADGGAQPEAYLIGKASHGRRYLLHSRMAGWHRLRQGPFRNGLAASLDSELEVAEAAVPQLVPTYCAFVGFVRLATLLTRLSDI